MAWEQTLLVDRKIESGEDQKLVKYRTASIYRLHPDKRELKNLFSTIVDSIPPDTILQLRKIIGSPFGPADTLVTDVQVDPEDFEFLSKAYPNPTTELINIELHQKNKITYQLTDISGKTVLQGQFSDTKNKIDLSGQSPGIYSLTLMNPANNFSETTKIIKAN